MSTKWTNLLIDDIIDKIKDGKIIPIIGPDSYYIVGHEDTPVQKYVIEKLIENCTDVDFSDLDADDRKILHEGDFRSMTLLNKKLGRNLRPRLKYLYNTAKSDHHIRLKPQVKEFLEYGKFPLILTTYYFSFLDDLLCDNRNYEYVSYRCEKKKEQDIPPESDYKSLMEHPNIFHLFGTIGSDKNVALTENDFLKFLHCYHDINKYPDNLKEYLEDKYVLSLGSNIPDWTARFLLYSLKENDINYSGEAGSDSFDGGFLSMTLGKDLAKFLNRISYFSHTDFNDFLNDINRKFNKDRKPTLFVSLDSSEYDSIGSEIKNRLSGAFEVKIYTDFARRDYWNAINTKINECDLALIIVTSKAFLKLYEVQQLPSHSYECKDDIPGLITEWLMIKESGKPCTIVLVDVSLTKFRDALTQKDPDKSILRPLFFPEGGNQAIILSNISEISADKVI